MRSHAGRNQVRLGEDRAQLRDRRIAIAQLEVDPRCHMMRIRDACSTDRLVASSSASPRSRSRIASSRRLRSPASARGTACSASSSCPLAVPDRRRACAVRVCARPRQSLPFAKYSSAVSPRPTRRDRHRMRNGQRLRERGIRAVQHPVRVPVVRHIRHERAPVDAFGDTLRSDARTARDLPRPR